MGGRGEFVSYKRMRAVTKKQRQDLKTAIASIVDNVTQAITIIALVDEPAGSGPSRTPRKSPRPRRRAR